MAVLTEKESEVKHENITGKLLAEYNGGECSKVIATIEVDWAVVTWSLNHRHGEICLWDEFAGGFTSDWKIAVSVLNTDFMLKLRKEIDKLVK